MAILCPELRLLFIQTPHTGCTAIGGRLRQVFDGVRLPDESIRDRRGRIVVQRKHATLRELMEGAVVSAEQRRNLLVAAGVRNPFDMVASEFVRTTRGEDVGGRKSRTVQASPGRSAAGGAAPLDFESWLRWRFGSAGWTGRLRGDRYSEPRDFADGADQVIRFERLQEDFDALLIRLGVKEHVDVPHINPTVGRHGEHYSVYYTPGARQIVEGVYGHWLERFGYRFEAATRELAAGAPR